MGDMLNKVMIMDEQQEDEVKKRPNLMRRSLKKKVLSVSVPSVQRPDLSHMRVARILCVQCIFGCLTVESWEYDENFSWNPKAEKRERLIASEMMKKVIESIDDINAVMLSGTTKWEPSRMTYINRSIITLALMELLRGESEKKIILNEAIELSKFLGEERDYKFINAFLDKVNVG